MVVLIGACGTDPQPTGNTGCLEPPASELSAESRLVLALDPNPTPAGQEATLSLSLTEAEITRRIAEGLPADVVGGAGAAWQCWDGSRWVDTHQIVRGFAGEPRTLAVAPGQTTTIPAIGLRLPNSYQILIPDVPPGLYRIEDTMTGISGFVIVEVR